MADSKPVWAGGDPWAEALTGNPYNVLPSVQPDDPPAKVSRAMLNLQRRRLSAQEDHAFRTLRNVSARLSWDARTLGTTTELTADQWTSVRTALAEGRRGDALDLMRAVGGQPGLHATAVIALNEVTWQGARGGSAEEASLRRYVANWAPVLSRREWLEAFARQRCAVWGMKPPNADDMRDFLSRTEKAVAQDLALAAGPDAEALWTATMERESAVIEAVAKACGAKENPPAWPGGYGPFGLAEIGAEAAARAWLVEHAARASGAALPIAALRSGTAGFYQLDPDRVATAARAVQILLSELGAAAANLWHDKSAKALEQMGAATLHPASAGPWFGVGPKARRSREEAVATLHVEALLSQMQDELARPEVLGDQVCDTMARLLQRAEGITQPRVAVRQAEARLCGRIAWCLSSESSMDPTEVERIILIGLEVRSILQGRGEGVQTGVELAKLLNRRAAGKWTRAQQSGREMRPRERDAVLRDLFQAASLAPHSQEVVMNLAALANQFPVGSPAERRSLLTRVLGIVEDCMKLGKATSQLMESRDRILEAVDPQKARELTMERLRKAMEGGKGGLG